MYGAEPALPDAAATTMPASTALSEASRIGVAFETEIRAQRHADHLHVVRNGPVDRVDHHVGRPGAAEHAHRVQIGERCDARPIVNSVAGVVASSGRGKSLRLPSRQKPVAVPEVWLPWPLQSSGLGSGTGTLPDRFAL